MSTPRKNRELLYSLFRLSPS